MEFAILISCFLFGLTGAQNTQLCTGGGLPSASSENCYQFMCSGQSQSSSCPSETFYDDSSRTCLPLKEYSTTEQDYDNCRCSNTLKLGLVEGSKNTDNEYLYCEANKASNRYTCANIPSTQTRPSDCGLCDTENPTAVQGNCNSYQCGQLTQKCPKNQYFDDSTKKCVDFTSYVNANENENDSCRCFSSQQVGLVEGSKNAINKYLYCTATEAKRYLCSEIPPTETKPTECAGNPVSSICQNGPPIKVSENCAKYKCGLDPEIFSCQKGKYFSSESKNCESATVSLSNECICQMHQLNDTTVVVKVSENRLILCDKDPIKPATALSCPKDLLCKCIENNEVRIALSSTEHAECLKLDDRTWIVEKTTCENGQFYNSELFHCETCQVQQYEYKAHPCDKSSYLFTSIQKCPLGKIWSDTAKSCIY